jgi:hypothetical protein
VHVSLDEFRATGKKSKKMAGEEYEEKINAGARVAISFCTRNGDVCGAGDEESEIRALVKKWEDNTDVYDLTSQAIEMFTANVRYGKLVF